MLSVWVDKHWFWGIVLERWHWWSVLVVGRPFWFTEASSLPVQRARFVDWESGHVIWGAGHQVVFGEVFCWLPRWITEECCFLVKTEGVVFLGERKRRGFLRGAVPEIIHVELCICK